MTVGQKDLIVNELLHRMQAGDTAALAPLYDCTSKPLFAYCFIFLKNRYDCEDALSETYLKVHQNIASFRGNSGYAWLSEIAKNICLNKIRQGKRTVEVDFDDEAVRNTLPNMSVSPSEPYEESPVVTVARCILNETEFHIVIMHAVSGRKFKEIASDIGKPEATVRWSYNNSLKKIRKEFDRRGIK